MDDTASVGALDACDQQEQDALDQTGILRRLVTIEAIRAEIGDNPNLTDEQCAALEAATDQEILDAIDSAANAVEDRLYALHDEIQSDVVSAIAPS